MRMAELLKLIEKKRRAWNERSQFKIKGVGNLSVADLDMLELYADTYLHQGSYTGLMEPTGSIKEVLKHYE